MKRITITCLYIALSVTALAQSLPKNLSFDENQHRLKLSGTVNTGLYQQSTVEPVYLDFYISNYWAKLKQYYDSNNYVLARLTYKGEVYDSVGIQFKGKTSYRKPSERGLDKLSFDIKLGHVIDGQDIDGYSTLNFNNAWEDPSFLKEVVYGSMAKKHIPAAQGNFIRLYLNGADWGLYPNIQQVNNDFLKQWFMNNNGIRWRADAPSSTPVDPNNTGPNWGDGTAALNYLENDSSAYKKYYTLKSSELENPWDYLISVCDVLNNTPIEFLHDSIKNYINIDATLWFLATEILFSDDDSYVHKGKMDYSLYMDEETGLMQPLEIDGNSAMKIQNFTWDIFYHATDENYPLLNRLLQVPELRQRYIAHIKTIIEDSFNNYSSEELIDPLATLIDQQVRTDPKKFQPYDKFLSGVNEIKQFIAQRRTFSLSRIEMKGISPTIQNSGFSVNNVDWETPNANETVEIKASASHPAGIKEMNLYYGSGFFGNFEMIKMTGNGPTYTANIKGFTAGEYVRYYIEAVANDNRKTRTYEPAGAEHDVYVFRVNIAELTSSEVVINELMASNDKILVDDAGEFDDWIELYNNSPIDIQLDGYYLTDNPTKLDKWPFPEGTSIQANGFLILWADKDEEQAGLHTNFKLSASGEELYLVNNMGQIADQVYFTAQTADASYGRLPNGIGAFQKLSPSPNTHNSTSLNSETITATEIEILIYPNPASDFINIIFSDGQLRKLSVFDITGKKIMSVENTSQIDISQIKPGLYILIYDEHPLTAKQVIQHSNAIYHNSSHNSCMFLIFRN